MRSRMAFIVAAFVMGLAAVCAAAPAATRGNDLVPGEALESAIAVRGLEAGGEELQLVGGEDSMATSPQDANSIKFYWKILNWNCVCGGKVLLYIDGKYKGYATGPGTYTVRRLRLEAGRRYTFYAVDACGTTQWGPRKYKMKASWSSFTWSIYCSGGGIVPTAGTWTGTTSRSQPMSFLVLSGGTQYSTFTLKTDFNFGSCWGWTETTVPGPGSISGGSFSFTGSTFSFTGQFTSATTATGTYAYTGLYIYPCGYLYQSGTWQATWTSAAGASAPADATSSDEQAIEHHRIINGGCDGAAQR
ncbi:MAG: hypothetical protein AB1714_03990 [Acidobacteriota bacterium]